MLLQYRNSFLIKKPKANNNKNYEQPASNHTVFKVSLNVMNKSNGKKNATRMDALSVRV